MFRPFTQHPATVGEGYWQHLAQAAGFGLQMLAVGLACIAHGMFPFLFQHTGSDAITRLHVTLTARRRAALSVQRACTEEEPAPSEAG
jgi:hypothetical protein